MDEVWLKQHPIGSGRFLAILPTTRLPPAPDGYTTDQLRATFGRLVWRERDTAVLFRAMDAGLSAHMWHIVCAIAYLPEDCLQVHWDLSDFIQLFLEHTTAGVALVTWLDARSAYLDSKTVEANDVISCIWYTPFAVTAMPDNVYGRTLTAAASNAMRTRRLSTFRANVQQILQDRPGIMDTLEDTPFLRWMAWAEGTTMYPVFQCLMEFTADLNMPLYKRLIKDQDVAANLRCKGVWHRLREILAAPFWTPKRHMQFPEQMRTKIRQYALYSLRLGVHPIAYEETLTRLSRNDAL